jgi:hypothetical protein
MEELEQELEAAPQTEDSKASPSPSPSPRADRKAGSKKAGFPNPSTPRA